MSIELYNSLLYKFLESVYRLMMNRYAENVSKHAYPKDTKSQLIRNTLCMNWLADFIIFNECP